MPSTPGRYGQVKMSGTATTFTDEATTAVTANQAYQVTNTAKQVFDPTFTITVKNGGVAVDPVADPYTLDRLTGTVTFVSTASRTITMSGKYLPMTNVAKTTDIEYTESRPPIDDTTFDSNGWSEHVAGLGAVAVTLGKKWETVASPLLMAALTSGSPLVLEIWSNRSNAPDKLFWLLPTKHAQSVKVTDLVNSSLDFVGYVDADGRTVSNA